MRIARKRDIAVIAAIGLLCGVTSLLPPVNLAHGWSIDLLTTLRWQLFGQRRDPASLPVAVIAIDEETYASPPFKDSPTPTWTTEIGRVLTAVLDGGAKVVGFDVVFSTSIEQSEIPFGDDLLGARLRGFDRPFLLALREGASTGKVVLGEVLRSDGAMSPSPGQRIAVRQQQNIRPLNVVSDPDEVVRRVPLTFAGKDGPIPSMALELAARAQQAQVAVADDGVVTLAGYRIPSAVKNTMALNFHGGNDVQTYSFADLHGCLQRNDLEFFHRQFADRVVLFGTLLDEQDRKQTSKRFATGLDQSQAPRCASTAPEPQRASLGRSSIAGVYIHATAVANLIQRDALVELGRIPTLLIAAGFAALIAFAARILSPAGLSIAYLGMVAVTTLGATLLFMTRALVLPLSEPFVAGLAAAAMMISYRLVVTDRWQRLLRRSFALYLAPQVIDGMLKSNKLPVLGGETREVTVFFSDLEGFSSIAERMTPTELVAFMNEYLSAMTEIIESEGGYVEKYIADSIVAVFGAPVNDPAHARHAAFAALRCRARLEELNRNSTAFRGIKVAHRMGLNSGEALVGNIGSKRRFNYSVMSDAVNVASRLEGANKHYGTTVIASETTVVQAGPAFAWRELDAIRVKGRSAPVKIFELVGEAGAQTPEQREVADAYAEGLAHWRAKQFELAAKSFARVANFDKPSAQFLKRAEALASNPPGKDWDPTGSLESK